MRPGTTRSLGSVTIHDEHPFRTPRGNPDEARRFRGRLVAPVTLWLCPASRGTVGLTVSSVMIALGEPATVLGLVDPDSELGEALVVGAAFTVSALAARDLQVADAFAGLAPAPGGALRMVDVQETAWGPRLARRSWLGARVTDTRVVGWSHLVTAAVEAVAVEEGDGLAHLRGRYLPLGSSGAPGAVQ